MHAASLSDPKTASASTTASTREIAVKVEGRPLGSAVSGIETDNEDTVMERTREELDLRWKMTKAAVRHPLK